MANNKSGTSLGDIPKEESMAYDAQQQPQSEQQPEEPVKPKKPKPPSANLSHRPPPSASEEDLRQTLLQFFICYSPERLMEVPMLMHRFPHDTNKSGEIKLTMRRDFGQEPVADEARLCLMTDFRTRLYCFYAFYAPAQFKSVDDLVYKYHGREAELMDALMDKYGEEEAVNDLFLDWLDRDPSTGLLRERIEKSKSGTTLTSPPSKSKMQKILEDKSASDAMQIKGTTQAMDGPPPPPYGGPRNQNAQQLPFAPGEDPKEWESATQERKKGRVSFVQPGDLSPKSKNGDLDSDFGPMEKSLNVSSIKKGSSKGSGLAVDDLSSSDQYGSIPWAESGIFEPDSPKKGSSQGALGSDLEFSGVFTQQSLAEIQEEEERKRKPRPPPHCKSVHIVPAEKPKTVVPLEEDHSMHHHYHQILAKVGVDTKELHKQQGPALKTTTAKTKPSQLVYHNAESDFSPPAMLQDTSTSGTRGGAVPGSFEFETPLELDAYSPISGLRGGGGMQDMSSAMPTVSRQLGGYDATPVPYRSGGNPRGNENVNALLRVPQTSAPGGMTTTTSDYSKVLRHAGVHHSHSEPPGTNLGLGGVQHSSKNRKLDFMTADDLDRL